MSATTSINEIVKNALIDLGEDTEHLYQRCLHWGFEGLKDWNFDAAKEFKTVKLEMSPSKTINLPLDYVDYCKIGTVIGDKVFTFLMNPNIEVLHDVDDCGDVLEKPTENNIYSFSSYYFGYNGYYGFNHNLYGGNRYDIGTCRIDRHRNQIVFSSEVDRTEVYLEYITNGLNPTGESLVNPYAAKVLKLYILWSRKENSDKYSGSIKERARFLYYEELRKAKGRMRDYTIEDLVAANMKGYRARMKSLPFLRKTDDTPLPTVTDDCPDVFPTDDPITPPEGTKKIYWGSKANPFIDTSEEILSLESEFFPDRLITKTFNATGGRYIYFAYPVAYGVGAFTFNNFTVIYPTPVVVDFTDAYGNEDYYVYRSNQLQHGDNIIVQIT